MILRRRLFKTATSVGRPLVVRRCLSSAVLDGFSKLVQSYISPYRDPFVNLSIEHFLLQTTAPDSAILFLYVNRPSIIIGRNQNPWLEVNLSLLHQSRAGSVISSSADRVDLVRRRSGGGTVFHDEGNVNWTVITPSAKFTRDKHAELVVRALRGCGIDRARVNERHDIVLDQGDHQSELPSNDTHRTSYHDGKAGGPKPLKVSGSAYKLTRGRALHHGTCLLHSPNLSLIPQYLRSPAKNFITARGVESVSSPVGNIQLSNDEFISAVQNQFINSYSQGRSIVHQLVDDTWAEEESVRNGASELKSPEWTFMQTPQFTLSTIGSLSHLDVEFTARYGAFTDGILTVSDDKASAASRKVKLSEKLKGQRIHEVESWRSALSLEVAQLSSTQGDELVDWIERMLPVAG